MSLFLLALLAAAASGVPGLFLRRRGGEVAAGLLGLAAGLPAPARAAGAEQKEANKTAWRVSAWIQARHTGGTGLPPP